MAQAGGVARQPRPSGNRRVLNKIRENLQIVTVDTPNTLNRDVARQQVRQVLREILGDEELISCPGQPIRQARQGSVTGISVSHEAGLSLVAVNYAGSVGIDLMRPLASADWFEQIPVLAHDYLGPEIAQELACLTAEAQVQHFAERWTEHEACLKYLGMGLEEWQPALAQRLSACRVEQLLLPGGYIGAVAY
jgi:4'-phosphopantetheinyl transferase